MCPSRKIIKQWQYNVNGVTDNKVASQCLCVCRNPFPGQPTIFLYYPISIFFFQGICESAQGFANFIFFCLLTKKFQENSRRLLYRHCPCLEEIWEYDATIEPTDQSINPADGYNILDLESTEMNETVTLSRTSNLNANYLAIT